MNIDISKIVLDKLEQMDAEGVIRRKIEETIEKSILDVVTSELGSYSFHSGIANQIKESVSSLAADCGLSGYNGFIVNTAKNIVQQQLSADLSEKLQEALNNSLLRKYENITLSGIFGRYREWVLDATDEDEKYERQEFTCSVNVSQDGASFTHYICQFADHVLEHKRYGYGCDDDVIQVRFCCYGKENSVNISSIYLDGRNIADTLRIGTLTDFEAFLINLYFNKTKVLLDTENLDDFDTSFDVDY